MNPNSRILKLRSAVVLAFLLLLAACRNAQPEVATTSSPTATAIQVQTPTAVIHASPGAAGLGDPIYPELGNGGYDVEHYTIELDVDVEANQISGSTIVEAVATQDLSSFDLDFSGLDISLVEVSGREAEFRRDGSELIIELPKQLAAGTQFSTAIQYAGTPKPLEDISAPLLLGWQTQPEGLFVASEPAGAMNWYPNNNHPLDKATYTYRLTVPKPYMVAANGLLEETVDNGETTTYVWQMDDPMASYLATVHIGRYEVETSQGPNGIPIRNYFPITIPQETRLAFEPTAEMMAFMEELIAPYPFDVYGVVLLSEPVGWALETQTLATFGASRPPEFVVFHELAHEWFGNSVSPASWQDTWLNEGFAAYLSRLWEEQQQGSEFFAEQMADNYELLRDNQVSPPIPESPRGLFSRGVYERGAWTLHALRLAVGDELFFEILRTYYDRYQYSTASTADFLAVVTELAGPEAADLVTTWLTEPVIPPLQ